MKRAEDVVAPNGKTWEEIRAKRMAAKEKRRKKSQKGQTKARTKKSRVGKLGIVRLFGDDMENLRRECFERDDYACRECGKAVSWSESEERIFAGKWAWTNAFGFPVGQMAHIRTKRNNGDTLDNVRTLCPDCHTKEHAYGKSMKKPCPKKERACGVQG